MKYQVPMGMKDLTVESKIYRKLEEDFFEVLLQEGFLEIRTPILEDKQLFTRSVGEGSDIVTKEMFETKDGLVLRPENTAPVMRAYVNDQSINPKLAYFSPQFRRERPQKGRLRQFYQYGFEIINEASPQAEISSLLLINKLLSKWNLTEYEIQVNFLGDKTDRANYLVKLTEYLTTVKDQLSPLSQDRLSGNVLRILDSKEPADQAIIAAAPVILDSLSQASKDQWEQILTLSKVLGLQLVINPYLVRGLDYYTGMVLEVVDKSNRLGSQKALGGGGRYDNLSKDLGGPQVSAFGFAGGVERLLLALNLPSEPIKTKPLKIGLITTEMSVLPEFVRLKDKFPNLLVDINYNCALGFKKMFKRADKAQCTKVVIVGQQELTTQTVKVKDLTTGVETVLSTTVSDLDLNQL
jgi:histidyl-tRNA synthetase